MMSRAKSALHRKLRAIQWPTVCPLLAGLILAASGCRTPPTLGQVNLREQGWMLFEGQAVWRFPGGKTEIAGELQVATRPDGRSFVQFSKAPFPLVVGQADQKAWEVEFPPQNKHYSGRGAPPKRIIWLYLPWVLSGRPAPPGFVWRNDSSGWRLANHSNGEALEGYFNQ
jgi:hypothetical protein